MLLSDAAVTQIKTNPAAAAAAAAPPPLDSRTRVNSSVWQSRPGGVATVGLIKHTAGTPHGNPKTSQSQV